MSKLRRYFFTGLLIILPIFITVYFLFVIFRFIDGIWGSLINFYLRRLLGFSIPGLGFILGMLTVIGVGFLATHFLGKRIFLGLEHWVLKFPFVRQVYPAVKKIVGFFLAKDKPAFKEVVLLEYPAKGIWSIGFVTNGDSFQEAKDKSGKDLLHVFIATTPSPFSGFLVLMPKEEVKYLNISIEEGLKLIVSGGILKPA